MIRKISISIPTYIRTWLPSHKRQPFRQKLFEVLLTPFKVLAGTDYKGWRDAAVTKANVTNEPISLQWYLNTLFDSTLKRIYILKRDAVGLVAGLSGSEPTLYQTAGLSGSEPTLYVAANIEGEDVNVGYNDFGVFIPASLSAQQDNIIAIVKRYAKGYHKFQIFII
ncbi:MAG: hypothetical protein ACK4EY_16135 [Flavipsychrobacter sp.]